MTTKNSTSPPTYSQSVPEIDHQPSYVQGLPAHDRDKLIVSTRKVDSVLVTVSVYGDDIWWLSGPTTNTIKANTKLDFGKIPAPFRGVTKAMLYRMMRRGRGSHKRAGTASLYKMLTQMRCFYAYLQEIGIRSLKDCSPTVCNQYVHVCKTATANLQGKEEKKLLTPGGIYKRLVAVEAIYELSQYCDDAMERHPWPDVSADYLSGYGRSKREEDSKTPLMPDDVFGKIFQYAWSIVANADQILDLRDRVDSMEFTSLSEEYCGTLKTRALNAIGWDGGMLKLRSELLRIRTACYVVIASLSGCRNHELSFLKQGAHYSTQDDKGEIYWWMKSRSTKTRAGDTQWMIPDAAVTALKVMDRWAVPYQMKLKEEIENYRSLDPRDIRISEAQEHVGSIFVGADNRQANQVRTLGTRQWNALLKTFARSCGLEWRLATHHFRRKFANYAARSRFGDLRYLKEHFKHWSLDMTLHYALNGTYEAELYAEIDSEVSDIKEQVVEAWLDAAEPLAGGYGSSLVNWRARSEHVTLFKSHAHMITSVAESTAIRSNGHAWCTADDDLCVGNSLEPTRCATDCGNSVIGRQHSLIYQQLLDDLEPLQHLRDIGEGGRARVRRDIARCRHVLNALGHETAEPN
ncbi:site-specific integrase [Burkholderia cepacia]|uniref:hypothetical protein n=1 Tax=Burkholderia cepacia TaxID=292 RepID=UPI001CF13C6C|nr:hypothetical protein [Burkholderia cepacia]MCA8323786.1 hypothetical protein [Burkholderia cepacia]